MKSADEALHPPPVILVLDTGTHAPWRPDRRLRPSAPLRPPSVILVLDTGTHAPWRLDRRLRPCPSLRPLRHSRARHGNPRPPRAEPPTTSLRPPASAPLRHSRAPTREPTPLPPLRRPGTAPRPPTTSLRLPTPPPLPSFSCPDTGIHASRDRTADTTRASPAPDISPSPRCPHPPNMLVEACRSLS